VRSVGPGWRSFFDHHPHVAIDVVLLDQRLRGRGDIEESGLDLISQAQSLAPFAKMIIVTAYATSDAIERAFEFGIYDYLVKNGAFATRSSKRDLKG